MNRTWRWVAAVASGGLLYCAAMLEPWWWAAWLAPIPLLVAAFRASGREARWLAMAAGLIGAAATASYYALVTGVAATVLISALLALAWGFVVGTTRDVVVRWPHWPVIFLYPALWAALDTLVAALSPQGSAGTMVFSQVRALPVLQVAALTGAPGVVFLFSLFASAVAIAIFLGGRITQPGMAYGLASAAMLLALAYGAVRLDAPRDETAITVGLTAIDQGPAMETPEPRGAAADAVWTAYGHAVAGLAARGAKLVVLPEKIARLGPGEADRLRERLAGMARQSSVYLLAGVDVPAGEGLSPTKPPGQTGQASPTGPTSEAKPAEETPAADGGARGRENRAWFFSPHGELLADYSKQHPVPGLEAAYRPGHVDMLRTLAGSRFGIVICKDLDYSGLPRRYARAGASVLLQPAWDFDRDGWVRAGLAALRSVEDGVTIVHATRNGVLAVTDRYGRVVAAAASSSAPVVSLLASAPLGPGLPTLYARRGDWFGWLCVAACAAAAVAARLRRA
jgi:apolipoprotein N-acyltransferase